MPFSSGVLVGLAIAVFGALLFFATRYKKAAMLVMGVGFGISIFTILFIVLAANSQM